MKFKLPKLLFVLSIIIPSIHTAMFATRIPEMNSDIQQLLCINTQNKSGGWQQGNTIGMKSGVSHPYYNRVYHAGKAEELNVEKVVAHMGSTPFSWWVNQDKSQKGIGDALEKAGFVAHQGDEFAMYFDLANEKIPEFATLPDTAIEQIKISKSCDEPLKAWTSKAAIDISNKQHDCNASKKIVTDFYAYIAGPNGYISHDKVFLYVMNNTIDATAAFATCMAIYHIDKGLVTLHFVTQGFERSNYTIRIICKALSDAKAAGLTSALVMAGSINLHRLCQCAGFKSHAAYKVYQSPILSWPSCMIL